MTLKQEQILGVQVAICDSLVWHQEQYGEAVPFVAFGDSRISLHQTALKRLLKIKAVCVSAIKNIDGVGTRRGYEITPYGRVWLEGAKILYGKLKQQSSIK